MYDMIKCMLLMYNIRNYYEFYRNPVDNVDDTNQLIPCRKYQPNTRMTIYIHNMLKVKSEV